jgi:hypothetical protein
LIPFISPLLLAYESKLLKPLATNKNKKGDKGHPLWRSLEALQNPKENNL